MRVFGYVAYAHVPDGVRRKLDKNSEKLCFLGYADKAKGRHLLDVEKGIILIFQDLSCSENEVILKTDEKEIPVDEATVKEAARESSRIRKPPKKCGYDEFADRVIILPMCVVYQNQAHRKQQ